MKEWIYILCRAKAIYEDANIKMSDLVLHNDFSNLIYYPKCSVTM